MYRLLTSTRTFTVPVPVLGSLPASVSVSKRRTTRQSQCHRNSGVDLSSRTDSTDSLHLSNLYPTPHEVELDRTFPSGHHTYPYPSPDPSSSVHPNCNLRVDTDSTSSNGTSRSNGAGDLVRSVAIVLMLMLMLMLMLRTIAKCGA